jgi:CheY-like chemotaxis protein
MSVSASPILLVEDNPDDVLLIQSAFEKVKASTPMQVVNDGEKAIAYLSGKGEFADRAKHPMPALVLLDLKLPRVPGLNVLSWLRKQPELARMLVVVLTSSRESADINRAYDLGANSYLVKPVSHEDLVELIGALETYWVTLNEWPDIGL